MSHHEWRHALKRFKNILVVLNDDGLSEAVLARAKWLAQANDAKLTLFAVKETKKLDLDWIVANLPGRGAEDLGTRVDAALDADARRAAADLAANGADVDTVVAAGVAFVETIRQVLSNDHDLVLKGAEQSFDWRTLGGADLHLLRKCPCPVWILKSGGEPSAQRIMAAVDPDPDDAGRDDLNHKVMQLATSLAVQDSASLDVLNAWHLYAEHLLRSHHGRTSPEDVDALLEETRRKSRVRLDALISGYTSVVPELDVLHIKGEPADVIVHHVEEQRIDTLVMGTLGRVGIPGMFIGNTAESVLTRVECSVLAVKPENFVSPVRL
ncbi:MAG: universal stress protein [Pseudomonadota bacterium]